MPSHDLPDGFVLDNKPTQSLPEGFEIDEEKPLSLRMSGWNSLWDNPLTRPSAQARAQAPLAPGMIRSGVEKMPIAGPVLNEASNKLNAATYATASPLFPSDTSVSQAPTWSQRYNENLGREQQAGPAFAAEHPDAASAGGMAGYALGAAPALAFGPAGIAGQAAVSGGVSGLDTLTRGGSGGQAATDTILGALGSTAARGAAWTFGKGAEWLSPKVKDKIIGTAQEYKDTYPFNTQFGAKAANWLNEHFPNRFNFTTPPAPSIPNVSQSEINKIAQDPKNPYGLKPIIERTLEDPSPEKTHAIGTALGAGVAHGLGFPVEAGAFVGYGAAPIAQGIMSTRIPVKTLRDASGAYVHYPGGLPVGTALSDLANKAGGSPSFQAIVNALQKKTTEDVKK